MNDDFKKEDQEQLEESSKETTEIVEEIEEAKPTDEERLKEIDVNWYYKKWLRRQNAKQAILIYGVLLIIIFNLIDNFIFNIVGPVLFISVLVVAVAIAIVYVVLTKKSFNTLEDREKYYLCSSELNKIEKYYEVFPEEKDQKHVYSKKSKFLVIWENVVDYASVIIAAIFTVVFIFTVILFPADVNQESMKPTLNPNDKVLVFHTKKYNKGDIIVFEYNYDYQSHVCEEYELLIKRIIASPGDTFECINGVIYVNGEKVEESYIGQEESDSYTLTDVVYKNINSDEILALMNGSNTIPDGYYLVLGDNRLVSRDSEEFGLVHESQLKGKVKIYRNDSGWHKLD